MSALAVPPSPRLRAVSAASAEAAAPQRLEGARAGRPHLRLVTPDFVPEPASAVRGARPLGPAPEGVRRGEARLGAAARPVRLHQERVREGLTQTATVQGRRQEVPVVLRRLVVLACAAVIGVLVVAGGIVLSGFVPEPVAGGTATVQQGESLWDIASATGAQDVSAVVSQIAELNNLESTTLQPGQTLVLPAG
nr:LysM peptidoglycan-binding domain-containing protein [Actinomyces sp.]